MITDNLVSLGDTCEVIAGQSPPSSTYNKIGEGLPFFQGKADFGLYFPKVRIWCNSPQKIAKIGDILISVRAPVGPTNICDKEACIGRGLSAIRAGKKINPSYLLYFLKKNEKKIANKGRGSTFFSITQTDLKEIQIPLCSLEEQKRIVRELDAADMLRQKRKQAIALLDEYLKAMFLEMFGDIRAKTSQHPWGTLRPLVSAESGKSSKNVLSGSKTNFPIYGGNGINGWAKQPLYTESVVIAGRVGQQCGVIHVSNGPCWVTDNAIVLRIYDLDKLNLLYLADVLKHSPLRDSIKHLDLPFINQSILLDQPIPLAKIELQNRYANIVKKVEFLKQKMTLQSGELEINFNALMQKAFEEKAVEPKQVPVKIKNVRAYSFGLMQGIAAIVEALGKTQVQYGEMVTAKFLYLLQEVFKVPFGVKFAKNNFGPYNPDIKKAIESGISKSKYFARKNDCLVLGEKAKAILKETYPLVVPSRNAMESLLEHLKHVSSMRIELVATVCKAIEDSQSTDVQVIQRELADWKTPGAEGYATKAEKFSDSVAEALAIITRLGWDKMLLKSNDQ